MNKFAFIYLGKEDPKNWSNLLISLELVWRNILKSLTCDCNVIIFCEDEPI